MNNTTSITAAAKLEKLRVSRLSLTKVASSKLLNLLDAELANAYDENLTKQ